MSGNPSPSTETARDVMTWFFRPYVTEDPEQWGDLVEDVRKEKIPAEFQQARLADRIKEDFEDSVRSRLSPDVLNSLLHLSLCYVDWYSLAAEVLEYYEMSSTGKKKRRSHRCRPEGRPRVPGRSRSASSPWGRSSSIRCWWVRTPMGRSATSSWPTTNPCGGRRSLTVSTTATIGPITTGGLTAPATP